MDGWVVTAVSDWSHGRVFFYYVLCFKKAPQQDSARPEISSNDWSGLLFQVAKFLLFPFSTSHE